MKTMALIASLMACFIFTDVYATQYTVFNTTLKVYAQSSLESTAHMVQSSNGIYGGGPHPWCGNRAYISFDDKEQFATALKVSESQTIISFIYEDAAAPKNIAGHVENFPCKIVSIFYW
jgi:hypothetical protein